MHFILCSMHLLIFGAMSLIMSRVESTAIKDDNPTENINSFFIDDMEFPGGKLGLVSGAKQWPKLEARFNETQVENIKLVMSSIEKVTCIRFVQAKAATASYVNIITGNQGCTSNVGYLGHKQMTFNRDNFVQFHWAIIQPGEEDLFSKLSQARAHNFGVIYDYKNIMHYGPFGYSVNGLPTVVLPDKKDDNARHLNGGKFFLPYPVTCIT